MPLENSRIITKQLKFKIFCSLPLICFWTEVSWLLNNNFQFPALSFLWMLMSKLLQKQSYTIEQNLSASKYACLCILSKAAWLFSTSNSFSLFFCIVFIICQKLNVSETTVEKGINGTKNQLNCTLCCIVVFSFYHITPSLLRVSCRNCGHHKVWNIACDTKKIFWAKIHKIF